LVRREINRMLHYEEAEQIQRFVPWLSTILVASYTTVEWV
jgi:hypothetical protein